MFPLMPKKVRNIRNVLAQDQILMWQNGSGTETNISLCVIILILDK